MIQINYFKLLLNDILNTFLLTVISILTEVWTDHRASAMPMAAPLFNNF